MKIAVIIAEFNPLHKGHEYLIEQTRKVTDCTHIVVIQTGNFTQRAEPAIIEKHLRAQSAIMCGIDAVLEMPTVFATNKPEVFAKAGVQIANTIPHAITTTTIVRIAVARFDPTPSIPIFASIDVNAAKTAEPSANQNHILFTLRLRLFISITRYNSLISPTQATVLSHVTRFRNPWHHIHEHSPGNPR